MTKTCFVTGATGFVGKRLIARLVEEGYQVKCLVRSTAKRAALQEYGVEFVDGDLDDVAALRRGISGVDVVFHVAGLTRETHSGDFQRVNVGGTRNVVSVCAEVGVGRLVYVSSLAGAGIAIKAGNNVPADEKEYAPYRKRRETDLPKPISPYGRSKRAAETALLEYADKVSTVVVRPPYVFGEGDLASRELYKMVKRDGVIVIPGYIDYYYSFVHVDDLVGALVVLSERGERLERTSIASLGHGLCAGEGIYFPACPTAIKFSHFGTLIGRGYGRERVSAINVPPMGVLGTGVYGEIVKTFLHKHAALDWNKAVEAVRGPWICSGAKLAELGVKIDPALDEKIARAARWYEKERLL